MSNTTIFKDWQNYREINAFDQVLRHALEHYQQQHGATPPAIRVHPGNAARARELAPGVDVLPNGGTLACEVWLPVVEAVVAEQPTLFEGV